MKKNMFLLLIYLVCSCKVLPIKSVQEDISSTIELGTIGNYDSSLLQTKFHTNAIPVLKQKIRLSASAKYFDKSSSKNYNKLQHEEKDKIVFVDSIKNHTQYIEFNIIDKVSFMEELNGTHNKNVLNYLKTTNDPFLVSSISAVFPKISQKNIIDSDEIYLINNKNKKYVLEIYSNRKLTETIEFSQANLFEYTTSNLYWGENDKHSIVITDIANGKYGQNTYKTYQKALKKQLQTNKY